MTEPSPYVALKPLLFGTQDLQVGDPVPVEDGRNYQQMLRLGQIGLVPEPAAPAETQLLLPYEQGTTIIFVDEDGNFAEVVFLDLQDVPEEAREGLGLNEGDLVALVRFPEDPDGTYVSPASLLPAEPTGRLIASLQSDVETAEQQAQSLNSHVLQLQLLIQAIRTEGEPLAADFPLVKELAHNGITTRPGLLLLARGEQGKANLILLDRIGDKSADKILAALAEDLAPPAPDPATPPPTPEGA